MSRRKRGENRLPASVLAPASPAAPPGQTYAVRVRGRCPACGMMPEAERFHRSPYPAEAFLQRFGGRFRAEGGYPAKGFMEYAFAEEKDQLVFVQLLVHVLKDALAAVLELLPDAYRDAGVDPPPEVLSGDPEAVAAVLPKKAELLEKLLLPDTVHRLKTAV